MAIAKPFWTPHLCIGGSDQPADLHTNYPYNGGPYYVPSGPLNFNISYRELYETTKFLDGTDLNYYYYYTNKIQFASEDYQPDPLNELFVNVPLTKILPLLWNMKEWDVEFNCSFSIIDKRDYAYGAIQEGAPNRWAMSINKSGKFSTSGIVFNDGGGAIPEYFIVNETIFIPNKEPSHNTAGEFGYLINKNLQSGVSQTRDDILLNRLLPFVSTTFEAGSDSSGGTPVIYSKNITQESPSGTSNLSISINNYLNSESVTGGFYSPAGMNLGIYFYKICILPDNTADVYFSINQGPQAAGSGPTGNTNTYLTGLSVGAIPNFENALEFYETASRTVEYTINTLPFEYDETLYDAPSTLLDGNIHQDETAMNIGSATISVFGVEKEVFLNVYERRLYSDTYEAYRETTPEDYAFDFSLSYDIDVSEFWEYE